MTGQRIEVFYSCFNWNHLTMNFYFFFPSKHTISSSAYSLKSRKENGIFFFRNIVNKMMQDSATFCHTAC